MSRRYVPATLIGAALLLLTACADKPTPTEPLPVKVSGFHPTYIPAPGTLADGSINPNDTYVVADITATGTIEIYSDVPFYDPVSETVVTSVTEQLPREVQHIEGGYTTTDATVYDQWNDDPEERGGVVMARIVDNVATYYFPDGTTAPYEDAQELISVLGSVKDLITADEVAYPVSGGGGGGGGGGPPIEQQTTLLTPGSISLSQSGENAPVERWKAVGDEMHHVLESVESAGPDKRSTRAITRRFKKRGAFWVLDRIEAREETRSGGLRLREARNFQFAGVDFNHNAAKDSIRAARRSDTTGKVLKQAPAKPFAVPPPAPLAALLDAPGFLRFDRISPPAEYTPGAPNLVLQHGLASSYGTWNWIFPRLHSAMRVNTTLAFSLPPGDALNDQAAMLTQRLAGNEGEGLVFVGHSNGGLISRRVAQLGGVPVRAVVTLGSPQLGAPITLNAPAAVNGFLGRQLDNLALASCGGYFSSLCYRLTSWTLRRGLDHLIEYSISKPAVRDITPGSSFLGQLNGTYENPRRASITSDARGPWRFVRLGGDAYSSCDENGRCAGRDWHRVFRNFYATLRSCEYAGWIFRRFFSVGRWCGSVRSSMDGLDRSFDRLVAYGGASDAIVPTKSQDYPTFAPGAFAPRRYLIQDGDSHSGLTRSVWTFDMLRLRSLPEVGVPQRTQ